MKPSLSAFSAVCVFVLVGCTLQPQATKPPPTLTPVSHIYAFGDSYSDNGNLARLLPSIRNVTWEGRASNGPTAVEVLAAHLGVELTNYAVGGAKSGADNVNPLPNTGVLGQIEDFGSELGSDGADPGALYFIMVGANDYLEKVVRYQPADTPVLASQATDNIVTAVSRLAQLGAKRFLVVNTIDLAAMPLVVATERAQEATDYQALLNSGLAERLEELKHQLNVEITVFDYIALSARIRESPSGYGLDNVTEPCRPFGKPACDSPDQYYFWDEVHPTRQTHQIFGEAWSALFGK